MRVNGRSDPLTHVVYSCTDDCTAPHRPLSGESPLAKTKKFSSGSCVKHARQISNLQTPHQSKLQICCCIIHHIHNTLKLFSFYPIYKKKKKRLPDSQVYCMKGATAISPPKHIGSLEVFSFPATGERNTDLFNKKSLANLYFKNVISFKTLKFEGLFALLKAFIIRVYLFDHI